MMVTWITTIAIGTATACVRSAPEDENKVSKILKLESRHQKNKQPFLYRTIQDKYKGMRYYDRR